jgi:serine-type D-Ala-D-Ala carboxypeptidase (penicillin-binding protein 5/6)
MRRGRRRPRARVLVALVAVLAGGAGAAIALTGGSDDGPSVKAAAHAPPLRPITEVRHRPRVYRELTRKPPPGILISGPNAVTVHLRPKPAAALLFDLDTGRVLWRLHPMRVRPIASVTKIMTALLVAERLPYDATALIKKEAVRYTGSMVGVLPRGKRVPISALMYGMLLPSGNDAATALADRVSGSDRRFARLMNRRARELHLSCTHYVSAYGLQEGNRSCPADLAALTRIVMSKPRIAHVVRHEHVNIRFKYLKGKHLDLTSTNPLMALHYPGTIGLKTGYTDPAGRCFIGVARRDGHTLGAILLSSADTGGQAQQLLDAGFGYVSGAG